MEVENKDKFEGTSARVFRGKVIKGLGEGQYYISRKGYCSQFLQQLGFEPFPGTLNIMLDGPFFASKLQEIRIEGFRDEGRIFGGCRCYKIKVNGIEAAIVRPEKSSYPANVVEIVSPVRLRDALRLSDGDFVEVTLG
ncbi:MAG: CTP-dependent riboflavin kinase [Methanothrix sp.]|nr:CTP-dependent riboflavin kinase [Methanothrix sp.]